MDATISVSIRNYHFGNRKILWKRKSCRSLYGLILVPLNSSWFRKNCVTQKCARSNFRCLKNASSIFYCELTFDDKKRLLHKDSVDIDGFKEIIDLFTVLFRFWEGNSQKLLFCRIFRPQKLVENSNILIRKMSKNQRFVRCRVKTDSLTFLVSKMFNLFKNWIFHQNSKKFLLYGILRLENVYKNWEVRRKCCTVLYVC